MKLDQLRQVRADARAAKIEYGLLLEARRLWSEARPLAGTIGEVYIRGVGYTGPMPKALRFRPPGLARHPQVVAAVQSPTDELVAVELTILDRERPALATLPKVKFVIGDPGCGAVRLVPVSADLRVVETIEQAMLVRQDGLPAWAALHAHRICDVLLPELRQEAA